MIGFDKREQRIIWAATRSALESGHKKNKRNGATGVRLWELFEKCLKLFLWLLKLLGWYKKGNEQALDVKLKEYCLPFSELPTAFDGFKVLHLTDLHLDSDLGTTNAIIRAIENVECDVCVLTGDYRNETHGGYQQIIPLLQKIVEKINCKQGIFGTLGNHDSYLMVSEFEAMGIRVLCNETIQLFKKEQYITLSGTDDVHYYYTDIAMNCLEKATEGFKIALVHSPELFDVAANNRYNLYLCGHTHGGQICLPGGHPVFKHLYNGEHLVKGLWKEKEMVGYTSEGCGTSGIPIRFNSQSEVTLFTLVQKQ